MAPGEDGAGGRQARSRTKWTKWCWSAARRAFRWCARRWADYFGRAPHCELNPDEVVALGAAVQADILETRREDHAAARRDAAFAGHRDHGRRGGQNHSAQFHRFPRARRNCSPRASKIRRRIDVHVLQGERELAKDCRSLARFQLKSAAGTGGPGAHRSEIPDRCQRHPASGGARSAHGRAAHHRSAAELRPESDTEVERMLEESIEFAEQDFAERQLIEARNEGGDDPRGDG